MMYTKILFFANMPPKTQKLYFLSFGSGFIQIVSCYDIEIH